MINFEKLLRDENMKNKNTQSKKQEEQKEDATKAEYKGGNTIEPTDTWINKTRTKNGFIIFLKNDFKEGDILLGGIKALQEFIDGDRSGVNLGIMTEPEDEEEEEEEESGEEE